MYVVWQKTGFAIDKKEIILSKMKAGLWVGRNGDDNNPLPYTTIAMNPKGWRNIYYDEYDPHFMFLKSEWETSFYGWPKSFGPKLKVGECKRIKNIVWDK